ncbi:PRC-barrel domain-containing protein [Caballeronia sp. LZ035]|uniref:PRC-barrel domain-containing protein n=1 Tax=Caballeronia sp. LZ035 TaxID=3038568 RepID=UPI002863ECA6|nr:PRC-barrel domain-containing protein [Caballeronia sp. LZ035]MDR5755599.1 PRC-barrel domain-containing protein [Caballeronia sp. LZ035]
MKKLHKIALAVSLTVVGIGAHAQVAGTQPLSVTVQQSQALLQGWSAKKSILGKAVYNDKNEKIGSIKDLVVTTDATVSAAVISAGGFLGVATHDVAVPITSLEIRNGNFYLPGATKQALKDTPEFEYNKVQSPPKPHKLKAD